MGFFIHYIFMIKSINDYPNYTISDSGIVTNIITNKELKPSVYNGYPNLALRNGGKPKKFKIHRLVAEHFIENPYNKPCVNHKNGIRHDNNISNLEWVTYDENNYHRHYGTIDKYVLASYIKTLIPLY